MLHDLYLHAELQTYEQQFKAHPVYWEALNYFSVILRCGFLQYTSKVDFLI